MRSSIDRTPSPERPHKALLHPRYWPHWLGLGLLRLIALLPHEAKIRLGRPLGRLLYHVAGSRRRMAARNIALAFPNWPEEKRRALVRAHFESLGIGLMELLIVWWDPSRHGDHRRAKQLVTFHGLEHYEQLRKAGRPVIWLIPHFTHIDLTGLFLQIHFPYAPVYRPHDNPWAEYVIRTGRTRYRDGQPWVTPIGKDNVRAMLRHLKKGGTLFYLPDQRFRHPEQRVDATFFGHPAPSNPATSKLAQLTGAAVMPVFTRRIGTHYHVTFLPPLEDFPTDDPLADTERLHRLYEREIRANPAQYLWVHNRWNLPKE